MTQMLRVRRFESATKFEGHQRLQEKRWWGWHTIDREEIPSHVIISLGCFGDTGGWGSKFGETGSFGRDGVFTPHDPATYARKPSIIVSAVKRLLRCFNWSASKESCA
jgi:hypothetical protein